MVIEKNRVVTIDYKLQDTEGEVLDSSEGAEPLVYLHGNDNIIAGLEKHLLGKKAGDDVDCLVPAVEAYGERDNALVFTVPKSEFGPEAELEIGAQFEAHGEGGAQIVTVVAIDGDEVTIDANHPLAGEDLHFTVKVVDVREATAEELEHGHVHGGCSCGCEGEEDCGDGCGDGGCGCGGCH
ncbi:MAG TPA: peptidylprolyl isomerase [Spirochaetales bacterium]|nr:peptidylprolyl isomerase [Spirochaetales bacterium]HRY55333.1 peptidylprolyl isomerase [Spirochaetia bacterium]HRZ64415.1 peptidylprolyl isomerase [Spirochaetia bacterium]